MEQFVKKEYSGPVSVEQTMHTAQRCPYDLFPTTMLSSPQDVAGHCRRHCKEETAISGTKQAEITPGLGGGELNVDMVSDSTSVC